MSESVKLPCTWAFAPLSGIADINPRSFCPVPSAVGEPVHFVPMSAVTEEFGGIDVSARRPLGDVQKGYTSFLANDVLLAKITPCMENGKLAVVPPLQDQLAFGSTEFHVLRAMDRVQPSWLAYFLSQSTFRKHARQNMTGSAGQLRVSTTWLAEAQIPVAPGAEQTRIVDKLEELLSDLDAGVAELKAAQKKLGQYRQSLLKAAVEGALTAEWRKQQHAPLSPRGRGAGGEGANTPETDTWFRDRARESRKAQTPAEHDLWQQLRAKRFSGFKFRRQQVIGNYIVDFVCFDQKLVIELDGSQHADAKERDESRDRWLSEQGFRVLRFWNNEWMAQAESVLETIWSALHKQPPLPNPSPTRGEGLDAPFSLDGLGGEGETGAQLLERILTERRARWEAKQLAKFAEQGKTPPKDWQAKYPEPVQPDTTDLPKLPEGWVWASLDQLVAESSYGTSVKCNYESNGTPVLRIPNVSGGSLDLRSMKFSTTDLGLGKGDFLAIGDVLVIRTNGSIGLVGRAAAVVNDLSTPHYFASYLLRLRCTEITCVHRWILAVLTAHTGRQWLEARAASSAGQHNISLSTLLTMPVPLPPLAEQISSLTEVEDSHELIKRQEAAVELSIKQSAAQRQNILRAAFAGQLVPQDPNDEPASVLLERIRAERAARDAVKKPHGRKVKGSN